MSFDPFARLAPFIQDFVYARGWTELRDVQVEAARAIFQSEASLLLASGTASGKTEAAFLPILTLLHEDPPASVGVLYVSPIKALINDQFERLNDLLREANIPVWAWHGDVSQSRKAQLLKRPSGVLQTTPESLESLLLNRQGELTRLFGDLRFVVIDEVHSFMAGDRGRQVQCQLARLERLTGRSPRRIGLSATLGDYSAAEAWLTGAADRRVIRPDVAGGPRRIRLAVEHFVLGAPAEDDNDTNEEKVTDPGTEALARYAYDATRGRKCLIFCNTRRETEEVVTSLREIAERAGAPDVYHVHHGSIAASLREHAESRMRDGERPTVTAATVTMELGIDIGRLERVVQLGAPFSVSSFLQRLGRSGRRDGPSEMWFATREQEPTGKTILPEFVPWELLRAVSVVQLYLEDRWIEPPPAKPLPYSLLYHQTMSSVASAVELTPAALAARVLALPPFARVSQDDLRGLLKHLLSIDHLQLTEDRTLIVGLAGERVVRNFRFYAVFADNVEYAVRDESREIGSVASPPPVGERLGLAGRTWEVLDVDDRRRTVLVRRARGRAPARWEGGGGEVHARVLKRMRRLLEETLEPAYLQPSAVSRLREARQLAATAGLAARTILDLGGNARCVLPWLGTAGARTLERLLAGPAADALKAPGIGGRPPYYLTVKSELPAEDLARALQAAAERASPEELVGPDDPVALDKYDEFVPADLLRKAAAANALNLPEVKSESRSWV